MLMEHERLMNGFIEWNSSCTSFKKVNIKAFGYILDLDNVYERWTTTIVSVFCNQQLTHVAIHSRYVYHYLFGPNLHCKYQVLINHNNWWTIIY